MRMKKLLWLATTSLMWLGVTQAQATSFNNVVILGDSLSDGGNFSLANTSGTTQFRFTTNPGQTAAELVAEGVGTTTSPSVLGGTNYAWGSSGVVNSLYSGIPTLQQQLSQYLSLTGGMANPNTLYEVWGGANDIFGLVKAQVPQDQLITGTTTAATTELSLLSSLQQVGAKYVVVYNLPNMGLTPSALEAGAANAAGLTQLSQLYNYYLDNGLNSLSASGLNIVPVNVYGLLSEVVANPAAYGFTNVTNEACGVGSKSYQCGPAGSGALYTYAAGTDQSYLFADGVHPTTATHRLLAQAVLAELAAPGQMSLLSEVPLAITKAQYRTVKNEMLTDVDGGDTRVFFNLDYNHQKLKASDSSPQLNSNNVNFTFGSDAQINSNFSAGVVMSLNQQNGNFSNSQGDYKLFDVSGLGYGVYHQGNGYIGGFANAGSLHFTDIKRQIQLGTAERTETADAQGYHVGGGLDGGWWFNFNDLKTGPFVHLEWQTIKVNNFAEHGTDSTAMWFGEQQRDSFVTSAGWRLKGDWKYRDVVVSPFAEVAWNHDNQADSHSIRAGLNSMGGSFVLSGYTPDKNWGSASLGLTTQYSANLAAWASANGEFANNQAEDFGVNVGMKYSF